MSALTKLTYPSMWLVLAPPGSGKSYFLRHMFTELLLKRAFRYGVVFANACFNEEYEWLDEGHVHSDYTEEKLRQIVEFQKAAKEQTGEFPPAFIIFDDCAANAFHTPYFVRFASLYRHLNLTVVFSIQRLKSLKSPMIYSCCRYCVVFYNESDADIKILHEHVAGGLTPSWRGLKTLIAEQCQDRHCLIVNRAESDRAKKCLRYRAPAKQKKVRFVFE